MPRRGRGAMRERLVIQENAAEPITVTSLTRVGSVATAATADPHGFLAGDFVTVAGAAPAGYTGKVKVTVTGPTGFTYPVLNTLATPATGAITATYFSDAGGGRKVDWDDFATIWAELIPLRTSERLQAQALQSQVDYEFRTDARPDIVPTMRALWTPMWPPGAPVHTLEIHGVLPVGDGRQSIVLECGELV